ncbi:glucose-specific PTS system enzyme IIA component [Moraxella macacae 0408225]|uniref:Glucose-specific PTS system enzyme IIA component n=2 Tax=Pseudomonadota TaxID=1224 RepID=L2F9K7_9GAMM|nr:BCCT family transporter [Moraxella macacae]ELA09148.1 glucose-specific PTS system enzyme IIA component [Moraxella macacae 0408225]
MSLSRFFTEKSSFNVLVTGVTLLVVLSLVVATLLLPEQMNDVLNIAKAGIFKNFAWFYVLVFSVFLFFMLFTALSQFGDVKLGADEEVPEFGFLSWLAMLFAAGMGVGLMFFGVAEPLSHFTGSISTGTAENQAKEALLHTTFHWGLHAWAMYGVISLALAYFGFRYKLPLALRSCFYPLLKDKIHGKLGDAIDILALIATLFGIITTLGYGSAQMGSGLVEMGWVSENGFGLQIVVIAVVMTLAVGSAISGVGKGVKILSETNLVLAICLLLFVLATGPTLYLLGAFSDNLSTYFGNILELSFKTYTYEPDNIKWFNDWTVIYWAWWCSWAPFVGLFIARISRGRTIREFVFGILTIPTIFSILWFTVFGNGAIWLDTHVAGGVLSALTGSPDVLLFRFLDYLPLSSLTSIVALVSIGLFFITSADSGIYVLNNIASRDKSLVSPAWQAILWGVLMSVVAIVLMKSGGLGALQSVTMIAALPFALLMLIMCISLWYALIADHKYFNSGFTASSVTWTGDKWKHRLNAMLNQTAEKDILVFLKTTALPAMLELSDELNNKYDLNVSVNTLFDRPEPAVELVIHKGSVRDFMYGIRSVSSEVAESLLKDEHLPHLQKSEIYRPITYFFDGRLGYEVHYMTKNEIISDILKHYERYLSLMGDVGQQIMAHEQTELAE